MKESNDGLGILLTFFFGFFLIAGIAMLLDGKRGKETTKDHLLYDKEADKWISHTEDTQRWQELCELRLSGRD